MHLQLRFGLANYRSLWLRRCDFRCFFEKPATERKTGSAGFYNAAAFEQALPMLGSMPKASMAMPFNGIKDKTIAQIKADLGQVDLVVYSLASPRRTDPSDGQTYNSVLKPIGQAYTAKNLNTTTLSIADMTLEPANEDEIAATVKVMGGEDWELWTTRCKQLVC